MENNPTNIVIGPVRFSYLHAFEPQAAKGSEVKKYSVSAIIPKSDTATIAKVNAAIEAAKLIGKDSVWKGKIPANLKPLLHDGDVERPEDEAYRGAMYLNCNATTKPGLVDANRNPIMSQDELKSGDYGYLNISVFPYNNVSVGVGAGFNHLMKTKDGEALSSRISVDEAFKDIDIPAVNPNASAFM